MLVDTHCHFDLIKDTDAATLIDTAKTYGVERFLCVSVNLLQFSHMMQMIQGFEQVYASVGVHPNAKCDVEPSVEALVKLADNPKIIAIGETGLDYFRSEGDLTWQQERFVTHIAAAKQVKKPLIIHSRDAKLDTIRILQQENAQEVGGIMHCFVDDWETAQQALDMGFYISFSGIVTFKNAKEVQAVAQQVPLDRLLVETDAPYLAPMPHRGKINQPAYVKHVAEFVADLRGMAFEEFSQITTDNFFRLFHPIAAP